MLHKLKPVRHHAEHKHRRPLQARRIEDQLAGQIRAGNAQHDQERADHGVQTDPEKQPGTEDQVRGGRREKPRPVADDVQNLQER